MVSQIKSKKIKKRAENGDSLRQIGSSNDAKIIRMKRFRSVFRQFHWNTSWPNNAIHSRETLPRLVAGNDFNRSIHTREAVRHSLLLLEMRNGFAFPHPVANERVVSHWGNRFDLFTWTDNV